MRLILLILASCLSLAAQGKTWIVDSQGGGQFTDIQPAVDASAAGDRILVRSGNYDQVLITRGISLIGGPFVDVAIVKIENIPRDEMCLVSGIRIFGLGRPSELAVSNCAGRVHIQSLRGAPHYLASPVPVKVSACKAISFHDAIILAGEVRVSDSRVTFESCDLSGYWSTGRPSSSGLVLAHCETTIIGGSVTGLGGLYSSTYGTPAPHPGISTGGGRLWVTGGASITGGGSGGPGVGYSSAPAISSNSLVGIDPSVVLRGSSPVVRGWPPYRRVIPSLTVHALKLGTAFTAKIQAAATVPVGLVAGFAALPQMTSLGELWMHTSVAIPLGFGQTSTTGTWSTTVPLNGSLHPIGSTFTLQGIVLEPAWFFPARFQLTTAATVSVR